MSRKKHVLYKVGNGDERETKTKSELNKGTLVHKFHHISVSDANRAKLLGKLRKTSDNQDIIFVDNGHGSLEIRTTGKPNFVLMAIHIHLEEFRQIFRKNTAVYQVACFPNPPLPQNRHLQQRIMESK